MDRLFFFFKQKTAYEFVSGDWSSDVCSSDLSPITIGRAEDRALLARSASSRCLAAYVYAAAGEGESTTDLAWDGQTMIWENGVCLEQSERFPRGSRRSVADVDTQLLRSERLRMGTFDDNRVHHGIDTELFRRIEFELDPPGGDIGLRR